MNSIQEKLSKLTLKEKLDLLQGDGYWMTHKNENINLSPINLSDGPHGLRHQDNDDDHLGFNASGKATCFPTASATACSFDPSLLKKMGEALAAECKDQNVDILLGPGVNMKRSPLCGRNFEYFSEDPLLAGELAASMINGLQEKGVGVCLKHYACNSQEKYRLISNSIVDERTLHEIYLKPFEIAVKKSNPWSIMHSYNRVNFEYSGESKYLLQKVLRDTWGFNGAVISDWGALS
ncbi:MAG: glycoside hydrolase family 3 protein, partial [Bacilli bacterium]|nr:glycoside hydrolase family 3 protein [Bacilli bacterium]